VKDILIVVGVLGLLALLFAGSRTLRAECEAKGGVYLSREAQCVRGERIPL
jgi:hypothetical protein